MPWQLPYGIFEASDYTRKSEWQDFKYICIYNCVTEEGGYLWNEQRKECYKVVRVRYHDFVAERHYAKIRFRTIKDIKDYVLVKYVPDRHQPIVEGPINDFTEPRIEWFCHEKNNV